jgi:hypothetical protein
MSDLMPDTPTLEIIWSIVETFPPESILTEENDSLSERILENIKLRIWLSDREEAQLKTYIIDNVDLIRSHFEEHLIP